MTQTLNTSLPATDTAADPQTPDGSARQADALAGIAAARRASSIAAAALVRTSTDEPMFRLQTASFGPAVLVLRSAHSFHATMSHELKREGMVTPEIVLPVRLDGTRASASAPWSLHVRVGDPSVYGDCKVPFHWRGRARRISEAMVAELTSALRDWFAAEDRTPDLAAAGAAARGRDDAAAAEAVALAGHQWSRVSLAA